MVHFLLPEAKATILIRNKRLLFELLKGRLHDRENWVWTHQKNQSGHDHFCRKIVNLTRGAAMAIF